MLFFFFFSPKGWEPKGDPCERRCGAIWTRSCQNISNYTASDSLPYGQHRSHLWQMQLSIYCPGSGSSAGRLGSQETLAEGPPCHRLTLRLALKLTCYQKLPAANVSAVHAQHRGTGAQGHEQTEACAWKVHCVTMGRHTPPRPTVTHSSSWGLLKYQDILGKTLEKKLKILQSQKTMSMIYNKARCMKLNVNQIKIL